MQLDDTLARLASTTAKYESQLSSVIKECADLTKENAAVKERMVKEVGEAREGMEEEVRSAHRIRRRRRARGVLSDVPLNTTFLVAEEGEDGG